ncbi:EamA family transporter [Amycolatopsis azurea]|uniref:EamA family transporter n=1 Tax=Amycolatopsis azurea DSM 43854 TaxID=1238180 RepID=M2QKK9_9PSEU|nr:EamA family transporter [Amycolatopsis azurea]EMD26407.1 Permease of the drug/metabolite transporter (DMT) superfamily [Amycolatopsis azurea DSM 43854]OOC02362.1 EamA family transporter [Amycolatopsis azurea DSM 43854]
MAIIAERPVQTEPAAAKPTLRDAGLAALAPASWGTVYVVTATLLPPDRPLLAAVLRALPAGLLLLALTRRLPHGSWWWKTAVLGMLNFGAFLPLIFLAAYRLPGGVAATLGALQPLMVAGLALVVLRVRTPVATVLAAIAGAGGVALLTLSSEARLDPLGLAAMLGAVALVAVAIVLTKKWGRPEHPLAMTGWQLTLGGLVLAPATLLFEGLPGSLTTANLLGYGYIGIVTTALAYPLWFRGIDRLAPTSLSLLTLTNPLVATAAGFLVLGQTLTGWQLTGFAVALTALTLSQTLAGARRVR